MIAKKSLHHYHQRPTPTLTPSNPGGPGDGKSDGLGCASNDCSNHSTYSTSGGQVLGASTGPTQAVLGLSTTSGDNNSTMAMFQLFAAFILSATGFKFLKKNA